MFMKTANNKMKLIDAHIHLDRYTDAEVKRIIEGADWLEALLSVSYDLESSMRNLLLSRNYKKVKPAFGFHPEQRLPAKNDVIRLIQWMTGHRDEMIAVGEVGLPYYLRNANKVNSKQYRQYIQLLETFIELAKKWELPIVLHAVYDDASLVCDLLEKHSVTKAHFHWFKGDEKTISRMSESGYYISVTPEVVYKEKIQKLVKVYPLAQIMIETDGPWPFEGPFKGKLTHPEMLKQSIESIAKIKKLSEVVTAEKVLENTKMFYGI